MSSHDARKAVPPRVARTGTETHAPTAVIVGEEPRDKFTIIGGVAAAQRKLYEGFLARNGIEVAGIEFIRDDEGRVYTYDVNTNTNYNPDAEAKAGKLAMRELARFLGVLLG